MKQYSAKQIGGVRWVIIFVMVLLCVMIIAFTAIYKQKVMIFECDRYSIYYYKTVIDYVLPGISSFDCWLDINNGSALIKLSNRDMAKDIKPSDFEHIKIEYVNNMNGGISMLRMINN